MFDCVLIVVSYKSSDDVAALLETVPAAMGRLTWHAVIVNNDPSDDLRHTLGDSTTAHVVEAGANLGYAGGINLGLAAAPDSRWTIFLNPDLRLAPDAISIMARASGTQHAIVPTITDTSGIRQPSLRREPTILGSLGDAVFGDRWPDRPSVLSEVVRSDSSYQRGVGVDWATGAALLVPTAVARELGAWDSERFFLYSEETDYCRRIRTLGVSIHFSPEAIVSHRGGGSGASDALYALQEVNRARYFAKWHSTATAAGFAAVIILHNVLRVHRAKSRAALRALASPAARTSLPGAPR